MKMLARPRSLDRDNFDEMQRAYNACMALDAIKQVGIAPLQDLLGQLTKILAVDDWEFGMEVQLQPQHAKDLSNAIIFLEQFNIPHFVALGVGADDKHPV